MRYRIFDANNFVRKAIERDHTGLVPRTLYNDVQKMVQDSAVLYVWDGFKGNDRRKAIYPAYKGKRQKPGESVYEAFKMVQRTLELSSAIQFKVDGYEADDVIATLARRYAANGDTIEIWSNDYDMMQLSAEYPNNIFVGANPKPHVPMDMVRYYKVTVGDASDNIPGIEQFGDKTWAEVDKDKLRRFIDDIVADGSSEIDLSLPKRCKIHPSSIRAHWEITGFFPVDIDLIVSSMKVGKNDPKAADNYLKEFFL